MTSEGLVEMFEGDFADMCARVYISDKLVLHAIVMAFLFATDNEKQVHPGMQRPASGHHRLPEVLPHHP